jgi:hypothetical protein
VSKDDQVKLLELDVYCGLTKELLQGRLQSKPWFGLLKRSDPQLAEILTTVSGNEIINNVFKLWMLVCNSKQLFSSMCLAPCYRQLSIEILRKGAQVDQAEEFEGAREWLWWYKTMPT